MTERTPLYLALLIGSLVVGLVLLREPLFGPYRQMAVTIADLNGQAVALDKEIRGRQGAQATLGHLLDAYGDPLEPRQRSLAAAEFYRRIEALASACSLRVESVSPKPEVLTESGVLQFGAAVNLVGDTRAVVAFLAQLQSSAQVVGVDRVVVRRRDNSNQPLALNVHLTSYAIADKATRRELAEAQAKRAAERRRGGTAPPSNGASDSGANGSRGEKTP